MGGSAAYFDRVKLKWRFVFVATTQRQCQSIHR